MVQKNATCMVVTQYGKQVCNIMNTANPQIIILYTNIAITLVVNIK